MKEFDREAAQEKLDEVQTAQTAFWEALAALEEELGLDLSETQDYSDASIETLLESEEESDD